AEVADRYGEELQARNQAHHNAAAGMMLVHIDEELFLTPDQYGQIRKTLQKDWKDAWSHGPRLYLYPQYAQMPGLDVLRPHLTTLQKNIWAQRSSPRVHFGWEMELGLQDWFGGAELEGFENPPPKPAPNAFAEEGDKSES
ncbi:MAG: hypothetical protein MI861_00310, partial [Pirellulales bacterium]|nr:hypothetical protein [Pirellulales bacterium]